MIAYLRQLGRLEGLSLLFLLLVAMPIRAVLKDPSWVKITGTVHGFLFLMFVFTVTSVGLELRWPVRRVIMGWILSSVPFGTFWFERGLNENTSSKADDTTP